MAVVLVDVIPQDGAEHDYELHLPMTNSLELVRSLAADISLKTLAGLKGNPNAANKLQMRHFKYFEHYPRDRANACADTVLRPAAPGAAGWLVARMLESPNGAASPGVYRVSQNAGKTASSLVLSGRGRDLQLKVLLFADRTPADAEPRIFTVWTRPNELQIGASGYLTFGRLPYGRTVLKAWGAGHKISVGFDPDNELDEPFMEIDE